MKTSGILAKGVERDWFWGQTTSTKAQRHEQAFWLIFSSHNKLPIDGSPSLQSKLIQGAGQKKSEQRVATG